MPERRHDPGRRRRSPQIRDRLVTGITAVLGAYLTLLSVVMLLAPRDFYEHAGPWPPYNGHYVRDVGSYVLAQGVALLVAARLPSWRVPVYVAAAVQFAVHAANHLVDVDASEDDGLAVATLVALSVGAILLAALARRAGMRDHSAGRQ